MINIFWFRRDLRLFDNAGLFAALQDGQEVLPIFIFDKNILNELKSDDARVSFIHNELNRIDEALQVNWGSGLHVYVGSPEQVFAKLVDEFEIKAVFANRDYEPYARKRDEEVSLILSEQKISLNLYKDHLIFEAEEILKKDGTPYTVYTPYMRQWKTKLESAGGPVESEFLRKHDLSGFRNFRKREAYKIPSLEELGFVHTNMIFPSRSLSPGLVEAYHENRDYPSRQGTSKLGVHFRFGTISIREKVKEALSLSPVFLNELIWREFYAQILFHFPYVVDRCFRSKYDKIPWRNDSKEFELWCEGRTGYPLVDAGIRELNATGFMHNRVRMVVASFLTKHLLIDWRWGEAYFAEKLLDFDLASNNGGWQWAAGCGTDAAPYFRIFNPSSQLTKFDKDLRYVKKWVPEYGTTDYPAPMVDHKQARERCLKVYKSALN